MARKKCGGGKKNSGCCPSPRSLLCEGDGDVVGVVTPLLRGGAQVLHGDQVVELRVQLAVQEVEGKEEGKEGQVEVERRGDSRRNAHERG